MSKKPNVAKTKVGELRVPPPRVSAALTQSLTRHGSSSFVLTQRIRSHLKEDPPWMRLTEQEPSYLSGSQLETEFMLPLYTLVNGSLQVWTGLWSPQGTVGDGGGGTQR